MSTKPRIRCLGIAPALLSLAAPRAAAPGSELSFHPEEGASVERRFREETSFEVPSIVVRIGGTELPDPTPELSGVRTREIAVTDTFVELAEGGPRRLARRFDSIEATLVLSARLEGDEEEVEAELVSPLDGEGVRFRWDEDEEEYRCAVEGDLDLDGGELAGLHEDLDLRGLLPAETAARGDRWGVDAAELRDLFAPGGDLSLRFAAEPDGASEILAVEDVVTASLACLADCVAGLEGELTATWTATREEDGHALAVIELALEATVEHDASELFARRLEHTEIETARAESSVRSTWELEGHGRLLWDLDAGVFRELSLEIEYTAQILCAWRERFGSHELEWEMELELAGRSILTAECSARCTVSGQLPHTPPQPRDLHPVPPGGGPHGETLSPGRPGLLASSDEPRHRAPHRLRDPQ